MGNVTEVISVAAAAKLAVAETFMNGTFPPDNATAGLPAANQITGTNVASVTVLGGLTQATITIAFNANNAALNGQTVTLTATQGLVRSLGCVPQLSTTPIFRRIAERDL